MSSEHVPSLVTETTKCSSDTEPIIDHTPTDSSESSNTVVNDSTDHAEDCSLAVHVEQQNTANVVTSTSTPNVITENTAIFTEAASYPIDNIYNIKWTRFRGQERPVVTQNENGPCPIIAIANVLLLRGTLTIPSDTELLTGQRLVALLSDLLLSSSVAKNLDEDQLLNYQTTVSDAFNLFPSLQTGLDVNVRFTGVSNFEFTPALGVFDLFNITLFHGWLIDPVNLELAAMIEDRSYNQLVELIIELKASKDDDKVREGLLLEDFLDQTASQLTYHGLCELSSAVPRGQLAVFFRNNHFTTILNHEGRIYVLVADMGLLNEPSIVWEMLNDVDGDTQFVDSLFCLYKPSESAPNESSPLKTRVVKSEERKGTTSQSPTVQATSFTEQTVNWPANENSAADEVSMDKLAQTCSELATKNSTTMLDCDRSLAARLQLEEIESYKRPPNDAVKPKTVDSDEEEGGRMKDEDENNNSSSSSSNISMQNDGGPARGRGELTSDQLDRICPEHMLSQAKRELGSGSDLDVAIRLQWEEMAESRSQRADPPRQQATAYSNRSATAPGYSSTTTSTRSAAAAPRRSSSDSRSNCQIL